MKKKEGRYAICRYQQLYFWQKNTCNINRKETFELVEKSLSLTQSDTAEF